MEYMGLSDCELLDRSVGLAKSDVIFKSRTLDYMTPTCNGEKKLRRHLELHIWAYLFFTVFVMYIEILGIFDIPWATFVLGECARWRRLQVPQ